jgi:uncharacterized damage-inducible protein DinB
MTWNAPDVIDRADPENALEERAMLDEWLDWHRQTLLHKCAGLAADQLVLRSAAPSSISLLGLVRHMADVERFWFRIKFVRDDVDWHYSSQDNVDGDFDDVDPGHAERDFAHYREEVDRVRGIAKGRSLDETFLRRPDQTLNLRWIYVHLISEYARHNGHADLLRERIDGVTGE